MERLWAPWRLQYVTDTAPQQPGCFFCNAWNAVDADAEHLVLKRGTLAFVQLNRFPYNNGHLMVAPVRHFGTMEEATPEEAAELWSLTVLAKNVLADCMSAQGHNIGINQGKCAGAGVLDHLHLHVVPRWEGDTNFIPVMADIKVMPQHLEETYAQLRAAFDSENG